MFVYRVVKGKSRARDLSGTGAFKWGGRWNNKGTYMLYTSENSSLALLESLVHFDPMQIPPHLLLLRLRVEDNAPIYTAKASEYPDKWRQPELSANKRNGDRWMQEAKYLGIKVRSAVNDLEFNFLLNPLFPDFDRLVNVVSINEITLDTRLIK